MFTFDLHLSFHLSYYFSSVLIAHVLYIIPSVRLILKSQYIEYDWRVDVGNWSEVIYTFNNFNSVTIVWKNYFSWCVYFDYFLQTKSCCCNIIYLTHVKRIFVTNCIDERSNTMKQCWMIRSMVYLFAKELIAALNSAASISTHYVT